MKLKAKKNSKPILSDKIADALTLKPRVDIEDDQVFGTKPQTVTRGDLDSSDSEEDATISDFRKQSVSLLSQISKKYEGRVVSLRNADHNDSDEESLSGNEIKSNLNLASDSKDIDSEDDLQKTKSDSPGSESEAESDDYSITNFDKKSRINSADDDGSDSSEEEEDGEGYDISQMEEAVEENFEHLKKQNITEEAKKGISVRNQLLVWESLLEMRIHIQRCMNTANQLPMPETHSILKNNNQFLEETNLVKTNVATVLDKLLTLQNLFLKNYPETKALSTNSCNTIEIKQKKQEDSDEEIPSDTDNEEIPSDTDADEPKEENTPKINTNNIPGAKKRKLEDYEIDISVCHKSFKTFRDTAIQKWNDKTRLATATSIKNIPVNTILQQISYILSDKEKLIRRTQLKRTEYDIVGYSKKEHEESNEPENLSNKDRKHDDEYIPEIFDDTDFYHQLLRELIECKSSDISDPVQLSRQWIALQQMRSKMKRKVDTKATKGRKIKYVVHNQLVNFMAPVKCTKWSEESANELYSSLFGKMFEHNNAGLNGDVRNVFKLSK